MIVNFRIDDEFLELVNNIAKENDELKKEIMEKVNEDDVVYVPEREMLGLLTEIEELKQENNFLQKSKDRQQLSAEEGSKIIEQLVKENNDLKSEIENLRADISSRDNLIKVYEKMMGM